MEVRVTIQATQQLIESKLALVLLFVVVLVLLLCSGLEALVALGASKNGSAR